MALASTSHPGFRALILAAVLLPTALSEPPRPAAQDAPDLSAKAVRLDVLRLARRAQDGNDEADAYLERLLHLGELQQAGADAGTIQRAAEGISMGHAIEVLQSSAAIYRRRAEACNALAEFYARRERERQVAAPPASGQVAETVAADAERAEGRRQLEVLRFAFLAFREADRPDARDLIERAIHVRELNLKGDWSAATHEVRQNAPGLAVVVELLESASRLWAERGWEGRARACAELAETWRRKLPAGRSEPRTAVPGPTDQDALRERLQRMSRRLEELSRALDEVDARLGKIKRK